MRLSLLEIATLHSAIVGVIASAWKAPGDAVTDGKCRALVMSGGANNGVWEAGVIWGLTHYGDPADYAWDVSSGVSAGGINAGLLAVWPKGSEVEMSEWMSEKYAEMTNPDIYTLRSRNPHDLFFEEKSILDDDPALATMTRFVGERGSI